MIARLVSNLLESVWTMVGRLLVCWRRMRQAMDRGRGRNIISVKMSEITDTRILAQGIYLLFA